MFHLPKLSFNANQMKGLISPETSRLHYEKHHSGYVKKTNELLKEDRFRHLEDRSLEEICRVAENPLADQARQAWNHTFYWDCMCADIKAVQSSQMLEELIQNSFGGYTEFQKAFKKDAMEVFGSGWLWVVFYDSNQRLGLVKAQGSDQPFWGNSKPILVCDVWEHAYYVDYQNEREAYVEAFWNHLDWDFAEANLKSPRTYSATEKMRENETGKVTDETWKTQELQKKQSRGI